MRDWKAWWFWYLKPNHILLRDACTDFFLLYSCNSTLKQNQSTSSRCSTLKFVSYWKPKPLWPNTLASPAKIKPVRLFHFFSRETRSSEVTAHKTMSQKCKQSHQQKEQWKFIVIDCLVVFQIIILSGRISRHSVIITAILKKKNNKKEIYRDECCRTLGGFCLWGFCLGFIFFLKYKPECLDDSSTKHKRQPVSEAVSQSYFYYSKVPRET